MMVSFKQKIHSCCLELLDKKIQNLEAMLHDLKEGVENEAKSSAGDKHETARAMMQLEHEKISRQLMEANMQKSNLKMLNTGFTSQK